MFLGKPPRCTGGDTRLLVNGCRWVLLSGEYRRDLPQRYCKLETLQKRFTRWAKSAVWDEVFAALIKERKHPYMILNSPLLRAYNHLPTPKGGTQHQALARSRGGLITKIQMVADSHGRPTHFILTARQVGDVFAAPPLIEVFQATAVPADKAYDTGVFVQLNAESEPEVAIPNPQGDHPTRPHDPTLSRQRKCIKSCFNKLKRFGPFAIR